MLKLMIVDDSNIIRRKIQRDCDEGFFNIVATAKNGVEAIDKFKKTKPEVITMDLTMPQMNGIQCVEHIISMDSTVRILVVSALSDVVTGIEALEKGARGFLCKPFDEEQLRHALAQLTGVQNV